MVIYNPKDWFSLIFKFHKSDTFRKLFWVIVAISIYSLIVAYLEIEIWKLEHTNTSVMHSLLGFVLSLLLVFRTNTAYDRWWEGRKQWGALVNSSRNLAIKLNSILKNESQASLRLERLISIYPAVLKEHLRGKKVNEFPTEFHQPNLIVAKINDEIFDLQRTGKMSSSDVWLVKDELVSLTDVCGACERIKKTPIPYSYSLFIKKFIFIYVMSLPFGFVGDFGYRVPLLVAFAMYVLASLELLAEEIEDPFGTDTNDLPTDEIAETIQANVKEIFQSKI